MNLANRFQNPITVRIPKAGVGNDRRSQYDGNGCNQDCLSELGISVGNDQRSQYDGNVFNALYFDFLLFNVGNDQRSQYDGNERDG